MPIKKKTLMFFKYIYRIIGMEHNNMTIVNTTFHKIDSYLL